MQFLGVWFDSEKPQMNTFLKPLVQMFIDGWYDGIDVYLPDGTKLHTTALLLPSKYWSFFKYNSYHGFESKSTSTKFYWF